MAWSAPKAAWAQRPVRCSRVDLELGVERTNGSVALGWAPAGRTREARTRVGVQVRRARGARPRRVGGSGPRRAGTACRRRDQALRHRRHAAAAAAAHKKGGPAPFVIVVKALVVSLLVAVVKALGQWPGRQRPGRPSRSEALGGGGVARKQTCKQESLGTRSRALGLWRRILSVGSRERRSNTQRGAPFHDHDHTLRPPPPPPPAPSPARAPRYPHQERV